MTTKVTVEPSGSALRVHQVNHTTGVDFAPMHELMPNDKSMTFYAYGDNAVVVYENSIGTVGKRRGHFELYQSGIFFKEWRWKYIAPNGRVVFAATEGYKNKLDAFNSIPTLYDIITARRPA